MQLSMLLLSDVTLWLRQALTTAMLSKYVWHFCRAAASSTGSSLIGCTHRHITDSLVVVTRSRKMRKKTKNAVSVSCLVLNSLVLVRSWTPTTVFFLFFQMWRCTCEIGWINDIRIYFLIICYLRVMHYLLILLRSFIFAVNSWNRRYWSRVLWFGL